MADGPPSDRNVTGVAADGAAMSNLVLSDLTVDRGGRPVVHDVSIEVPPGEITTMLGPNGAGKSSLAAAIAGLARVRSGQVTLGGENITSWRPERVRHAGVSVVPEGRRLLTDLHAA